ncbi:hypothetical protein AN911_00470 [Mycobacteroides immunogenum]|uniref:Uncharacterized protein n=1 Tax=Mycobacteroides immunogenum TaxID=83262 RepID=A0A7V8LRG1_9MYCO|nr:hypothetical protein AN909_05465 [Mycobacteroides immunogenum]KPG14299.1 hypothetical protein AN908_06940 [Mycobacteroides immunogenum]KPG17426.1 hypothetical protein AN910_04690 [Mycobacteroides immunogenum]KPG23990.1 hypothetical protein AN911_00470 [Mycobacteroides immunogenum]KPG39031.1 hypothetical protein AN914_10025 [Mycobacteroides immunogenum]
MFREHDDVIVVFDGVEHDGEVLTDEMRGWVRVTMLIDPELDYGSGTERLSAHQTVMVRTKDVRLR